LEYLWGSHEEVGELGSRLGTKMEQGVSKMGVTWDKGEFKLTWGSRDLGEGETSSNWTSCWMITPWVDGSSNL